MVDYDCKIQFQSDNTRERSALSESLLRQFRVSVEDLEASRYRTSTTDMNIGDAIQLALQAGAIATIAKTILNFLNRNRSMSIELSGPDGYKWTLSASTGTDLAKIVSAMQFIKAQTSIQKASALQRIIREANSTIDPSHLRARLFQLEHQVCRIETPAAPLGTGFLIGPDTVITNHHVVKEVMDLRKISQLYCRFDYKVKGDGLTVNPGTEYAVLELIDHAELSPADESCDDDVLPTESQLDYAVLRLATRLGEQNIVPEDDAIESAIDRNSLQRKWISLPLRNLDYPSGNLLSIIHHPGAAPLKLDADTSAIIGLNQNGTRVRYTTNTEHGSSGAPCFNAQWELVALHNSGDPLYSPYYKARYNQGIPIGKIASRIQSNFPELVNY